MKVEGKVLAFQIVLVYCKVLVLHVCFLESGKADPCNISRAYSRLVAAPWTTRDTASGLPSDCSVPEQSDLHEL